MMSSFLAVHRDELMQRCAAKVAKRALHRGTDLQRGSGIAIFIAQLQRTLEAEERDQPTESLRISGSAGGDATAASEMGASATQYGNQLLELGFSVDQVVHGYGDLCQAVTDLALELDAPFAVNEFRTLNRCLDNAIASAVTAFSHSREACVAAQTQAHASEQHLAMFHSMRNALATASYAATALETGNLPISGSTGSILKRSLATLRRQLGESHTEEPPT
jgi:hypothetical protein